MSGTLPEKIPEEEVINPQTPERPTSLHCSSSDSSFFAHHASPRLRGRSERGTLNIEINALTEETRQRSRSAPLTIEAVEIASELKRRSDNFFNTYIKRSPSNGSKYKRPKFQDKQRRLSDRRSFHFDYDKYSEDKKVTFRPGSGTEV